MSFIDDIRANHLRALEPTPLQQRQTAVAQALMDMAEEGRAARTIEGHRVECECHPTHPGLNVWTIDGKRRSRRVIREFLWAKVAKGLSQ